MSGDNLDLILTIDDRQFKVAVDGAGKLLKNFDQRVASTGRQVDKLEAHFGGLTRKMHDWTLTLGLAEGAISTLRSTMLGWQESILGAAGEIEKLTIMLKGMSTGATETERMNQALKETEYVLDFAQSAPFKIDAITNSFVKMRSVGIDPMNGSLSAITNAVAQFGGNADTLNRATIAIQQMMGKTVISMEELRQQLGEAVPNAMNLMARSANVSVARLSKAVESGRLEAKGMITAMLAEMTVNFDGSNERMMDSWTGTLQVLESRWKLFANEIGRSGYLDSSKQLIKDLSDWLVSPAALQMAREFGELMTDLVTKFRELTATIYEYRSEIAEVAKVLAMLTGARLAIGFFTALTGSVLGLLGAFRSIVGIGPAVIGGIGGIAKAFERKDAVIRLNQMRLNSLNNTLSGFIGTMGGAVGAIWSGADAFASVSARVAALARSGLPMLARGFVGAAAPVGVLTAGVWAIDRALNGTRDSAAAAAREMQEGLAGEATQANLVAVKNRIRELNEEIAKRKQNGGFIDEMDFGRAYASAQGLRGFLREIFEGQRDLDALGKARAEGEKRLAAAIQEHTGLTSTQLRDEWGVALKTYKSVTDDFAKGIRDSLERISNEYKIASIELDRDMADAGGDPTKQKELFERRLEILKSNEDAVVGFLIKQREDNQAKLKVLEEKNDYGRGSLTQEEKTLYLSNRAINDLLNEKVALFEKSYAELRQSTKQGLVFLEDNSAEEERILQRSIKRSEAIVNGLQRQLAKARGKGSNDEQAYQVTEQYRQLEEDNERLANDPNFQKAKQQALSLAASIDRLGASAKWAAGYNREVESALRSTNSLLERSSKASMKESEAFMVDVQKQAAELEKLISRSSSRAGELTEALKRLKAESKINFEIMTGKELGKDLDDKFKEVKEKLRDINNKTGYDRVINEHRVFLETMLQDQSLNAQQRAAIEERLQKQMVELNKESASKFKSAWDQMTEDFMHAADDMSKPFASLMENMTDGFVEFAKSGKFALGDILESFLTMTLKMLTQALIVGPMIQAAMGWAGSSGFSLGGLFGGGGGAIQMGSAATPMPTFAFANGGIMSSMGEIPLKAYSKGGIATEPQLALFGEGHMNEAYVPLPDGRSIPVTMSGNSAPSVEVNVINQSGQQMDAQQSQPRFDGEKMILDVVLKAVNTPGQFRDGIRGAVR